MIILKLNGKLLKLSKIQKKESWKCIKCLTMISNLKKICKSCDTSKNKIYKNNHQLSPKIPIIFKTHLNKKHIYIFQKNMNILFHIEIQNLIFRLNFLELEFFKLESNKLMFSFLTLKSDFHMNPFRLYFKKIYKNDKKIYFLKCHILKTNNSFDTPTLNYRLYLNFNIPKIFNKIIYSYKQKNKIHNIFLEKKILKKKDVSFAKKMQFKILECLNRFRINKCTEIILSCGEQNFGNCGTINLKSLSCLQSYIKVPTLINLPNKRWINLCAGALGGGCIASDGEFFLWGANDEGNLGVCKKITQYFIPNFTKLPNYHIIQEVKQIEMGGCHTVMIDQKGNVWSAGTFRNQGKIGHHLNLKTKKTVLKQETFFNIRHYEDTNKQIKKLPSIIRLSSGNNHFLMLDENCYVWEMGITKLGQRISERIEKEYLKPRRMILKIRKISFNLKRFEFRAKDIICGTHFNLVLSQDGQIYSWGQNNWFQTGHINKLTKIDIDTNWYRTVIDKPKKISFSKKIMIISMAGGEHYAIALDNQGNVWSWGRNASKTLGRKTRKIINNIDNFTRESIPNKKPLKVKNIPKIKKISARETHWFALTINGELLVFGLNSNYKTGLGLENGEACGNSVFDNRNNYKYKLINIVCGCLHSTFHLMKKYRTRKPKRYK